MSNFHFPFQCYIRCYLTQVGIIKDDLLNRDKAIELAFSTSDEALDECAQESNGLQKVETF